MNFITSSNFGDSESEFIQKLSMREMKNLGINVYTGPVNYVDKKTSIVDQGKMTSYNPNLPEQLRPLFTKSNKFQEQKEFRFVFGFYHSKYGHLSVRKDPIDVPILPIAAN